MVFVFALLVAFMLPATVAAETIEGTATVLVEDYATTARVAYDVGGVRLIGPAPALEHLRTGMRVRATGVLSRGAATLTLAPVTARGVQPIVGPFGHPLVLEPTPETIRVLVLILNFTDKTHTLTVPQAEAALFTSVGSTAAFYTEASGSKLAITGTAVGPLSIAMSSTGCDYYGIAHAADLAAIGAGVPISQYTHKMYAFPINQCGWWGLGTIGGGLTWINGNLVPFVAAHELGHNLGLFHSHALSCSNPRTEKCAQGTSIEYGDNMDVMGSAGTYHMNAMQKEYLGWLTVPQISQATEVLLEPYETQGAPRAVKVKGGLVGNYQEWLYLEYRQRLGFDATIPVANTAGVTVHLFRNQSRDGMFLLDMTPDGSWASSALPSGRAYQDPVSPISISVHEAGGLRARVGVSFGDTPPPPPPPPPGPVFLDDFTRPDQVGLGNGWQLASGLWAVQGGAGIVLSGGLAVQPSMPAQSVQANFLRPKTTSGTRFGVVLRYQDAQNYLVCYRQAGGASVWRIASVTNGVEKVLKQVAAKQAPINQWFTVGCKISGGLIEVRDGTAPRAVAAVPPGLGYGFGIRANTQCAPGDTGCTRLDHVIAVQ